MHTLRNIPSQYALLRKLTPQPHAKSQHVHGSAVLFNTPPLLPQPLHHPPLPHHITISRCLHNASTKQSPSQPMLCHHSGFRHSMMLTLILLRERPEVVDWTLTVICSFLCEGTRAMNLVSTPLALVKNSSWLHVTYVHCSVTGLGALWWSWRSLSTQHTPGEDSYLEVGATIPLNCMVYADYMRWNLASALHLATDAVKSEKKFGAEITEV